MATIKLPEKPTTDTADDLLVIDGNAVRRLPKSRCKEVLNITDGKDGKKGEKGDTGPAGYSPVRGVDYWTEADQAAIVAAVAAQFTDVSEVAM